MALRYVFVCYTVMLGKPVTTVEIVVLMDGSDENQVRKMLMSGDHLHKGVGDTSITGHDKNTGTLDAPHNDDTEAGWL